MREYLTGIIALIFLLGICRLIAYKDGGDTGRKFAFSVLVLYIVFTPIVGFISDIRASGISIERFEVDMSLYADEYSEVAQAAFSDGVKSAVCREFSLSDDDVRVAIEGFDFENMRARQIRIFLSGRAALANYKEIIKYIEENGLGECDAQIEINR